MKSFYKDFNVKDGDELVIQILDKDRYRIVSEKQFEDTITKIEEELDNDLGDHLKNLLVVSPNVHAQFTYANLEEVFDEQGWLRRVKFNNDEFIVNQIVDRVPIKFNKEVHYQFD